MLQIHETTSTKHCKHRPLQVSAIASIKPCKKVCYKQQNPANIRYRNQDALEAISPSFITSPRVRPGSMFMPYR